MLQISGQRYAFPAVEVEEIIPLIPCRSLAGVPPYVSGLIDYRGNAVPVVDLGTMICGTPCARYYSTRILLTRIQGNLLGLIGEEVTISQRWNDEQWKPLGVAQRQTPFLGPVVNDDQGFIQRVEAALLLPEPVRAALFERAHS
jgi:chemotaxis-related protein WspB